MKRVELNELNVEVGSYGRGKTPRSTYSIRGFSLHNQPGVRMIRLSRRRPTKALTSCLHLVASFAIVIFVTGTIDSSFAADNPKSKDSKVTQSDELDIPGSFKDLSDAKDSVIAKRSPEMIIAPMANNGASTALAIDAEKAASNSRRVPTSDRAALKGAAKTIVVPYERAAASVGAKTSVPNYAESELVDFAATAYCLKGRTASGMDAKPGMIAADPRVLPLGTVVHLRAGSYTGTYTVMDTGGRIKGRRVDVYVASHREAMQFGRRPVKIKVLGRGATKNDRKAKSLIASEQ